MTSGHWADSTRSHRLPPNWPTIVQQVKNRDAGHCRNCGTTCAHLVRGKWRGGQVDHIQRGDDHRPANLALLCIPCHKHKTQTEANANRARRYRTDQAPPGLRPAHPRG